MTQSFVRSQCTQYSYKMCSSVRKGSTGVNNNMTHDSVIVSNMHNTKTLKQLKGIQPLSLFLVFTFIFLDGQVWTITSTHYTLRISNQLHQVAFCCLTLITPI